MFVGGVSSEAIEVQFEVLRKKICTYESDIEGLKIEPISLNTGDGLEILYKNANKERFEKLVESIHAPIKTYDKRTMKGKKDASSQIETKGSQEGGRKRRLTKKRRNKKTKKQKPRTQRGKSVKMTKRVLKKVDNEITGAQVKTNWFETTSLNPPFQGRDGMRMQWLQAYTITNEQSPFITYHFVTNLNIDLSEIRKTLFLKIQNMVQNSLISCQVLFKPQKHNIVVLMSYHLVTLFKIVLSKTYDSKIRKRKAGQGKICDKNQNH